MPDKNKCGAKRLIKMIPDRDWNLDGLKTLNKEIDDVGTVGRSSSN